MEQKKREEFLVKFLEIGNGHDCNDGEILNKLGIELQFCYYCGKSTKDFSKDSDICKKCCNK